MALKSASSFCRNSVPKRRVWFGALAAGMLLATTPALAEDPQEAVKSAVENDQIQRDAPDAKDAVQSAVGDDDIQRVAPFPGGDAGQDRDTTNDGDPERTRKSLDDGGKQDDIQHDPPEGKPVTTPPKRIGGMDLSWLPYVILGIIGIGLAYVLLRYVTNRMAAPNPASAKVVAKTATTSVVASAAPSEPARDRTFDEIDALAESGAFTEAVHRLLLLVQERLRGRIEHGIQVSLTSREILRRAKLRGDAATAFATLVAAVEVCLFGLRSANAATYAVCRENCRRVLAAAAE